MLLFFFFNDTATPEIYTLSLHDALPICAWIRWPHCSKGATKGPSSSPDRKSTRLNSSHTVISYAVFCLKKKTYVDKMSSVPAGLTFVTNAPLAPPNVAVPGMPVVDANDG